MFEAVRRVQGALTITKAFGGSDAFAGSPQGLVKVDGTFA